MENRDERHIGKKLKVLSNLVRRKIESELSKRGLEVSGSQGRIISFVYRQSQVRNVYQRDIEMEFDIRRSSVTNALQLLEKNGFITRVSVDEDARLKKIMLTDKGLQVYEAVMKGILEVEDTLSSVYTTEELNQLFYLLDKLHDFLEEQ